MINLLADDCLSVSSGVPTTLPSLFALMMTDQVDALPALRPHQKQALHCFLAQAGAMAMLAAGVNEPPLEPERWASLLRGLTPDFENDEPWCLVVDDLSKPAFMQPPVPEGNWSLFKRREVTPDALDMLVTSKNHDLKAARAKHARPEHWLFSLITLQTCDGFLGRGNYGISRMNGGFSSRSFVGAAPASGGWGTHLRRDIVALTSRRTWFLEANPNYMAKGGLGLLWLVPWDGREALPPAKLDPYYIEICRRIRLKDENGCIIAMRGSSECMRVDQPKLRNAGKEHTAPTGDPWTPVEIEGTKPLTVDGTGFTYRRLANLLDDSKFQLAPLQQVDEHEAKGAMQLVFIATARGQGETQGYHERRIVVPPQAVPLFMAKGPPSPRLASLARQRVQDVFGVWSKALRPALLQLFQSAPAKADDVDPKAKGKAALYLTAFERAVDQRFFDHLMAELAQEPESDAAREQRRIWMDSLKECALGVLATAEAGSPLSYVRRYRARAAAERVLVGALRRYFGDVLGEAAE